MFTVLDTNHLRELVHETPLGLRLQDRLATAEVFTTVVTAHEVLQGWAARINQQAAGPAQVEPYLHFQTALLALRNFDLLPFDDDAAQIFLGLRRAFRRVGTMDLKIASICLAHDATLLTRNVADFIGLPGLRVDNWLD